MLARVESIRRSASDALERIASVLLPDGGLVVTLVKAYFDESIGKATVKDDDGTTRRVPLLCVAGYLMDCEQSERLSEEWRSVLDDYGLSHFHMVDCAHGNEEFASLKKADRIQVSARMIAIIKRRTIMGLAVSTNPDQYKVLVPPHPLLGTAYTFSMYLIIAGVQLWAQRNQYQGDIAYFFEAGHESAPQADSVMNQVFSIPELASDAHYAGHSFVRKTKSPAVQAADLLAWQFYTDCRREMEGKPTYRKDYASLIQHRHWLQYSDPEKLSNLGRNWDPNHPPERALIDLYLGTKQARKIMRSRRSSGKRA